MNGWGRSTAPSRRDLSEGGPSASTSPTTRVEPCVCGGLIIALKGEDIRTVVEQHNRSGLHLFWRWRTGRLTLHRWFGR